MAEVSLAEQGEWLQLTVRDNGEGFDTGKKQDRPSLGLASMRERVNLLHGEMDIESAPGHGTAVMVWLPLQPVPA